MSRSAAAARPGEEEPYEAAHDAELEPFDAALGAIDGSADAEDLDTFDAADAEAALDPDLSATHGLDGADPGYGEEFDDSDDELTLETTGSP
jgi:hypothetical protein